MASHSWKWFDISSGKWCAYASANNKTIDDAYWAGEPSVKVTTGRRKYNIQFGAMVQANEETGNRRPIMIALKEKKKEEEKTKKEEVVDEKGDEKEQKTSEEKTEDDDEPEAMEAESAKLPTDAVQTNGQTDNDKLVAKAAAAAAGKESDILDSSSPPPAADIYRCTGLTEEQSSALLRASVGLVAVPVEPDAINAILRLCLRLTRHFHLAAMFAELGGIRLLLGLTQASGFSGFSSLASLLVRHVLEDDSTLRHTLEKVVRSSTATSSAATTKVRRMMIFKIDDDDLDDL